MPENLTSNSLLYGVKDKISEIRATLEDMRKHGLSSGLPQDRAFFLLDEIERLQAGVRMLENVNAELGAELRAAAEPPPQASKEIIRNDAVYGTLTARDPDDVTRELWTNTDRWIPATEYERLQQRVTNLFSALNSKQAKIDALMLEFCPGEMSAEQRSEWAANQRRAVEPPAAPEYELPCDVHLPPNTYIGRGAKLSTLIHALRSRERSANEFPVEFPHRASVPPCALTTKQRQDMLEKLVETGRVAHRQPFNVPANIAYTEAYKAVFDAMGESGE